MAYIVDLTNVLKLLFHLVANDKKKLTRRQIKLAYRNYYESQPWNNVHNSVKDLPVNGVPGRDVILEKMESLIRSDVGLTLSGLPLADLEQDEEWHT